MQLTPAPTVAFWLATVAWNPHATSGTSMISEGGVFVQYRQAASFSLHRLVTLNGAHTPAHVLFFASSGKTTQVQLLWTELQTAHVSGGAQRALPQLPAGHQPGSKYQRWPLPR